MKKSTLLITGLVASFSLGFFLQTIVAKQPEETPTHKFTNFNESSINKDKRMKLGAFSVSLSVKDLSTSRQFYENLGFKVFGGGMD